MSPAAIDVYLAGIDPERVSLVVALDQAVIGAGVALDCAVKYRMLTYAVGGDYHRWICAIDAHPRIGVSLRFLFGDMLDFSGLTYRAGSTTMRTIDYGADEDVDAARIAGLVNEAVSRLGDFEARERDEKAARRT